MLEYPSDRVVATPLQFGIDLVSIPESPNHRANHLTVSEMSSPSPSKGSALAPPHLVRRKGSVPDLVYDAGAGLGELQFYFDDVVVERSSTGGFAEACYRGGRHSPGAADHYDADADADADGGSYPDYPDNCSSGYSSAGEVPSSPRTSAAIKREDEGEGGHLWFEMASPCDGDHTTHHTADSIVPDLHVPEMLDSDPETTTELFAAYVEKAQHSSYDQAPAPPSKRKRLSLCIDIAALSKENIDHIITKASSTATHGAGGDSPPVVPQRSKPTASAKKRRSPVLRRRASPEPQQPQPQQQQQRHSAGKVSHKASHKAHTGKAGKVSHKAKKAAKTFKAPKVKTEVKTEFVKTEVKMEEGPAPAPTDRTDRVETPAEEKRRKMEGNRRAAKKFRLKQKAKEGIMMIRVAELETINAQLVAELALIRQLR